MGMGNPNLAMGNGGSGGLLSPAALSNQPPQMLTPNAPMTPAIQRLMELWRQNMMNTYLRGAGIPPPTTGQPKGTGS